MKSNVLLMMYAADILDGGKIEDVPQLLRADVLALAAHYTQSINAAETAKPAAVAMPVAAKEGNGND